MTPQQIEDAARRKYNSVGSTFYAQAEIWDLIYQAECEIARETRMLEGLDISTTTTAGTQSYAFPSGVSELKRVECDGRTLERIDLRDDDVLTLSDSDTTSDGTPAYYYEWNQTIYLRPIPDTSAQVLKLYHYKKPALVTAASQVLEVPAEFHMSIVDFVTGELCAKDKQWDSAQHYFSRWYDVHIPAAKAWTRKRKTGDKFNVVKDEADLVGTFR